MNDHVGAVFFRRLPRKMLAGDAGKVPITAGMCCMVLLCRRWSVGMLADDAVDMHFLSIYLNFPVAVIIFRIRPRQTLVAFIRENDIVEELERLPLWNGAS